MTRDHGAPHLGVADVEAARAAAERGDFTFTASDPAGAAVGFVGPRGAAR